MKPMLRSTSASRAAATGSTSNASISRACEPFLRRLPNSSAVHPGQLRRYFPQALRSSVILSLGRRLGGRALIEVTTTCGRYFRRRCQIDDGLRAFFRADRKQLADAVGERDQCSTFVAEAGIHVAGVQAIG